MALLDLAQLNRTRRAFKQGSHEPMYYDRDENGDIGIPPSPDIPVAQGSTRFTVDNLRDADKLAAEMSERQYRKFQDDGAFTIQAEELLGGPRSVLVSQMMNPKTEMEREVIRLLLPELDREEADRQKISSEVRFAWRES